MAVLEDPFDVRRARSASGLLAPFVAAGLLGAADVHVARCLATLGEERDEQVVLAAAFAVRAPRLGHVHVDLAEVRATAVVDRDEPVDLDALPWPSPAAWRATCAASPLCADGDGDPAAAPLRLVGTRLHLDRLWADERGLAADLVALASAPPAVDEAVLADGLARLFPGEEAGGRQALAAAAAVRGRLAVVAGGPGTGKTTTVARVLALLLEQAAASGSPTPLIALAAPTGKAAARLQEAVRTAARDLDVGADVRAALEGLEARTLHRLLGWRPDSDSRFRHDRGNRLAHDVVVVDESSMASLSLTARLAEAVRRDARLVLVGDPQQLVAVEAGAVLGDLVGAADGSVLGGSVVVLDRVHRFGAEIAALADAIRRGDADATVAELRAGAAEVEWLEEDAADSDLAGAAVRAEAVAAGTAVVEAARRGDVGAALEALGASRVLCAHRRGPYGVATWATRIADWLGEALPGSRRATPDAAAQVGEGVLVTTNDRETGLFNGDAGVVVADADGRPVVAFERGGTPVLVSPLRLGATDALHAMTVHKAQGSQVGTAVVLLPDASSRLLTRELLYTAVTRARERVVVIGTEAAVRAAVERPAARLSGLAERLA